MSQPVTQRCPASRKPPPDTSIERRGVNAVPHSERHYSGPFVWEILPGINAFLVVLRVVTAPWIIIIMTIGNSYRRAYHLPDDLQVFTRRSGAAVLVPPRLELPRRGVLGRRIDLAAAPRSGRADLHRPRGCSGIRSGPELRDGVCCRSVYLPGGTADLARIRGSDAAFVEPCTSLGVRAASHRHARTRHRRTQPHRRLRRSTT